MPSQFDMNGPSICGFCFEHHDILKTRCSNDKLMMIVKLLRAERATMIETQRQLATHAKYLRRSVDLCVAELERLYKVTGEDAQLNLPVEENNGTEELQAETSSQQLELPNLQRAQEN